MKLCRDAIGDEPATIVAPSHNMVRSGDRYVVEEGLAFGDRLLVKGQWSVKDSTLVEIKE